MARAPGQGSGGIRVVAGVGTLWGDISMWSWVAHRITGVAVLFFLYVHVLDTALVRVSPSAYDDVIASYKTPLVNLMEVGLVGAVLFHALNGLRIIAVDFWGRARSTSARCCGPLWRSGRLSWSRACTSCCAIPSPHSLERRHDRDPRPGGPGTRTRKRGGRNVEMASWVFMRASGLVLVILVLGHLLIMNILDGGVQRINFAFVAGRWTSPFWQFWDLTMLWLAMLHGTNGLRVIISDYARAGRPSSGCTVCSTRPVRQPSSWAPW